MSLVAQLVLVAGLVMAAAFAWAWRRLERRATAPATAPGRSLPTAAGMLLGAVTNFFDTLGIGSFASTTAYLKFRRLVRDELIPGTLNVGHALPTIAQAIIFTTAIAVAPLTLVFSRDPATGQVLCSDAVENRGHTFGAELSPALKDSLIYWLKYQ